MEHPVSSRIPDFLRLSPPGRVTVRRIGDMVDFFRDREEARRRSDEVVYRVFAPAASLHLNYALTVIEPGDVSGELFMTKGHYHVEPEPEVYVALRGRGLILMQRSGLVSWRRMEPGTVVYVPPGWAHRTVNVGDEPFSFLAVFSPRAGHDYDRVLREGGFAKLVLRRGEGYEIVDNPDYRGPLEEADIVMATGVFDILHPGHLAYLEAARRLGKRLYVVVARDKTAEKLKHRPILDEETRLRMVSALRVVDRAVLGSEGDMFATVEEIGPDVIALGYDQPFEEGRIEEELRRRGIRARVVRLPRLEERWSTREIVRTIARRLEELYGGNP